MDGDPHPEAVYEERWASAVMSRAFEQLRAEHKGERQRLFEALQRFVSATNPVVLTPRPRPRT
jgi:hypothetical protein